MKRILAAIALSCLAGSAFGQNFTPYVNPEEQERFDRITAPFLAGEVPSMNSSNFQHSSECEFAPESVEWWRERRAGEMKPGFNHRLNIYLYNQYLNVLETRDCSCAGRSPAADHTIALFDALPVDDHTGWKVGGGFYSAEKTIILDRLTRQYCGGKI